MDKKSLITGLILGVSITATTAVLAEPAVETIQALLKPNVTVQLDGKKIELKNAPIYYKDTNYLPIRDISSALGLDVQWDNSNQTVMLSSGVQGAMGPMPSDATVIKDDKNLSDVVYYKRDDVYFKLLKDANGDSTKAGFYLDVKNNKLVVTHKGIEYIVDDQKDSYYDRQNDITYFTEDFLLLYLTPSDLEGLKKYTMKNSKIEN